MKRLIPTLILVAWIAPALAQPPVPTSADGIVRVDHFIAPGATDCGPGIQAAIDSLVDADPSRRPGTHGGVIHFGKRQYIVTTPVVLRHPGVIMTGVGSAYSHACTIEWRGEDPKAALFTFIAEKGRPKPHGFAMRDIYLVGKRKGTAFRFGKNSGYCRDFVFDRVGVARFGTVFSFEHGTWGGLHVTNSTIRYNDQVVDCLNQGKVNEFRFRDCLLSKNGLGSDAYAFDIGPGGSNGVFDGCVLEGQPRPLRVRRFQQLRITGCRFEGNATSEDPVVLIEDSNGVFIQAFHRVLKSETGPDAPPTIELRRCRDYEVSPMLGKVKITRGWEGRY